MVKGKKQAKVGVFKVKTFGVTKRKCKYYYKCTYSSCTATFNEMTAWNIHHLVRHKRDKFTCDKCNKIFATPGSFRNHINLHQETKYTCPRCDRKFVIQCGLNIHKNLHRRQRMHTCFASGCSKRYKWRQDLLCHVENHIQSILFACKVCSYSTYEGRLYHRHVMVHTAKTPYKCHKCSNSYKHVMQRYQHKKVGRF